MLETSRADLYICQSRQGTRDRALDVSIHDCRGAADDIMIDGIVHRSRLRAEIELFDMLYAGVQIVRVLYKSTFLLCIKEDT